MFAMTDEIETNRRWMTGKKKQTEQKRYATLNVSVNKMVCVKLCLFTRERFIKKLIIIVIILAGMAVF